MEMAGFIRLLDDMAFPADAMECLEYGWRVTLWDWRHVRRYTLAVSVQ